MKTFTDDIKYSFIPRYQAIAEIIVINTVALLVLALILLVTFVTNSREIFDLIFHKVTLPSNLSELIYQPWTIVSYFFVNHPIDLLNFVFGMLWLFYIGTVFQGLIGRKAVWFTYITGGLAGAFFYLLLTNLLPIFTTNGFQGWIWGSNAGIQAIVVACATLVPNFTFVLFLIGPVKLKWIALFYVVLDVIFMSSLNPGFAISHLGGALMGFTFIYLRKQGVDLTSPFESLGSKFKKKEESPIRVTYRRTTTNDNTQKTSTSSSRSDGGLKPSQFEIDRILDKIAAQGYDKLSKEEKELLFRAGKD